MGWGPGRSTVVRARPLPSSALPGAPTGRRPRGESAGVAKSNRDSDHKRTVPVPVMATYLNRGVSYMTCRCIHMNSRVGLSVMHECDVIAHVCTHQIQLLYHTKHTIKSRVKTRHRVG